jgi:membrane AbrB-like protein
MDQSAPPRPELFAGLSRPAQWAVLLVLSALLAGLLEAAQLPAALLVGPMLAGIAAGVNGATVRPPRLAFNAAQAVVGCLIAASIVPEIFSSFLAEWPLFLGVVLATLLSSSLLGYMISRWKVLPGTTAVWGSTPGAASAMVLMADAFGADTRLVAFMQYLRVIFVSMAAAVIARFWVDTSGVQAPAIVWFPPIDWPAFGATIAVAAVGGVAGRLLRLPAGTFLGPMILGTALHLAGTIELQLPQWLLAVSYAMVGWSIGLNFTRTILVHAARALPQIILSIIVLVSFCAALGFAMGRALGIDPLTAYLATSPGGMDSVAIIAAASSRVDISFIMALQTARFVIVLLAGPPLARVMARRIGD